ncbi:Uncharacterised protein [Mycobacteroides abscessus subsp. abscessus]|nr:Uncharacterised protein [Mycobacteroides abscessus subsp. abscessus]
MVAATDQRLGRAQLFLHESLDECLGAAVGEQLGQLLGLLLGESGASQQGFDA